MSWFLGRTREAIGKIPAGVDIAFRRNEQRLAVSPTWWVVHVGQVAHISEAYGGLNCARIIAPTKRGGIPVASGPKTTAKLESLLVNLAKPYATNQVHSKRKNCSQTLLV